MIWTILSRAGLRYFGGVMELLAAFVFGFIVFAFYGEVIPTGVNRSSSEGDIYFYVRSNGIHTEVCLPARNAVQDWSKFIPTKDYGARVSKDFIALGWGDKGFYMNTPEWSDMKVGTAFNAIALPTPTAMHVTYSAEPIEGPLCRKVYVTKAEYRRMVKFIKMSFRIKRSQAHLIPGKGYGPQDNFYEANHQYHLFRTCNTWTNSALKEANVRTALFAVFPNGVMGHLK